MKVLKYGHENDKLPTMEVSCTGNGFGDRIKACGALLEVTGLDIKSGIHHDYGGGSDTYYYVVCPICGAKTEIYRSQMPDSIKYMV